MLLPCSRQSRKGGFWTTGLFRSQDTLIIRLLGERAMEKITRWWFMDTRCASASVHAGGAGSGHSLPAVTQVGTCWAPVHNVWTAERVRLWGRSSSLLVAQLHSPCCFNWIILKSAISVSLLFPKLSYKYCSLTITQLPNSTPEMAASRRQAKWWSLCAIWRLVEGVKHLEGGCLCAWEECLFHLFQHRCWWSRSLAPPELEEDAKPKLLDA